VVVLAARAIDELAAAGHVLAGSRVDLVHSGVAVAVPANAPLPPIATEAQLRAAVLAAHRVGYSTGPSGTALMALFERWGIAAQIRERLVQAPAGTPVAQLVARGDVSLGFQQLSEMLHVEGIRIVGPLPPEVQIITTFSAGIASTCRDSAQAKHLIDHLAAADTAIIKQRQGMEPA
jgi:molybdate transport system substrate-binding protein